MSVTLTLLYFASLRERAGVPSESLSTEAADLAGLYEEIQARHGIAYRAAAVVPGAFPVGQEN